MAETLAAPVAELLSAPAPFPFTVSADDRDVVVSATTPDGDTFEVPMSRRLARDLAIRLLSAAEIASQYEENADASLGKRVRELMEDLDQ